MTSLFQRRLLAASFVVMGLLSTGHSALAHELQPADDRGIHQIDAKRGDRALLMSGWFLRGAQQV